MLIYGQVHTYNRTRSIDSIFRVKLPLTDQLSPNGRIFSAADVLKHPHYAIVNMSNNVYIVTRLFLMSELAKPNDAMFVMWSLECECCPLLRSKINCNLCSHDMSYMYHKIHAAAPVDVAYIIVTWCVRTYTNLIAIYICISVIHQFIVLLL